MSPMVTFLGLNKNHFFVLPEAIFNQDPILTFGINPYHFLNDWNPVPNH